MKPPAWPDRRGGYTYRMPEQRRLPPPWTVEETYTCFTVLDASRQKLAYFYFEKEPGRRAAAKLLSRDEAFLLAVNFAKLPRVPRQILKDIPRPTNTAGGDD